MKKGSSPVKFRMEIFYTKIPGVIIYITFNYNNIFVNWYKVTTTGKLLPFFFTTLRYFKFAEKEISEKSIFQLVGMFNAMFSTVEWPVKKTILVIRNFGNRFKPVRKKRKKPNRKIFWIRREFLKALLSNNIFISAIIDRSSIPFNGCRTKKVRRKRFKHVAQRALLL